MQTTFSDDVGMVQALPIVPISAELIMLLEQMIPVVPITPGSKMEDIMYQAGRQSVLQMLRARHAANQTKQHF